MTEFFFIPALLFCEQKKGKSKNSMFVTLNFSTLTFLMRKMKKKKSEFQKIFCHSSPCFVHTPITRNIVQYEHIDMNCRKAMTESMR